MASKRSATKYAPPGGQTTSGPVLNALLVGAALCYGLSLLVSGGRVSWPPTQLLANLYTVAGCLGVIGPVVLWRSQSGDGGLGELLWMTGGLLIWVFDAVALLQGEWRTASLVTPLGYRTMGLTMLAVLIAGWRSRGGDRGWSWTNVVGWGLGLFWVGMAVASLWPGRGLGVGGR